jgi:prepilin-type N-terminal cleavage/methylation domain-containing protein
MRGAHMRKSEGRSMLRRRAFTLVELLVSISIIAVLTVMLLMGTTAVYENFRKSTTLQTFRSVGFAIDTFSNENPLRTQYDAPGRLGGIERSYGSFPPYQVEVNGPGSVGRLVEPEFYPGTGERFRPRTLQQRLTRDLAGASVFIDEINATGNNAWVHDFGDPASDPLYGANDDNRALYAYLRAFNPAGLNQVPDTAMRPLPRAGDPAIVSARERMRLPGALGLAQYNAGSADAMNWAEIRGFVDGWGNPLDYMLYVKVEAGVRFDPTQALANQVAVGWRITDRQWVLRSHGISADEYQLKVRDAVDGSPVTWDDNAALYSSPLPTPYAGPKLPAGATPPTLPLGTGLVLPIPGAAGLSAAQQREGGWVRLRAQHEWASYNYLPGAPF